MYTIDRLEHPSMAPCAGHKMKFWNWIEAIIISSIVSVTAGVSFYVQSQKQTDTDVAGLISDAVMIIVMVITFATYLIINKINSLKERS